MGAWEMTDAEREIAQYQAQLREREAARLWREFWRETCVVGGEPWQVVYPGTWPGPTWWPK